MFFNAALANQGLHIFQMLSFLASGLIFWWPIVAPIEDRHMPALAAVSYLFSACVCCSLAGRISDLRPGRPLLDLTRHIQLDPRSDQQLAGMLMWVPGCFVYLSGILWTVMRWYGAAQNEN